jgi:hypothetical protein
MSSSVSYCLDALQGFCEGMDQEDLNKFFKDTLGYKRFNGRELFQDYKWLLDEEALSEWLVEYLNERGGDSDMVEAIVESAFEYRCDGKGLGLLDNCLSWLKNYEPAKKYRSVNLVEPIQEHKTIVLTETTAATSTLLSLKTELADTKRELDKRTFELAKLQSEYNSIKRESKSIAENYLALVAKHTK